MSGRPCIFGEVLFDHFPDGRRVLGGTAFNVAWHLHAFGGNPYFLSRVGDDAEGAAVRAAMQDWGMDIRGLQTSEARPTGSVRVSIRHGEPSYDIAHPAAWDEIEPELPETKIGLLYHGSLALRSDRSRRTCRRLRDADPGLLFIDVNLRSPWWRREQVLRDLDSAHWVKLNRQELDSLAPNGGAWRHRAFALLHRHRLRGCVITNGAQGAEILTAGGERLAARPAEDIVVADTVGAGDALAAVMILGLLRGWELDVSLRRAQSFASAVVGQHGATVRDAGFYAPFIEYWALGPPAGD